MNNSAPYDSWPFYIGNPDIPLEVRENTISISIMAAVGSFFAWPMMISQYQKSQSALALVSLMLVITTTLVNMCLIFFSFQFSSLVAIYHNAAELMFLLLAMSHGLLRYWHLFAIGTFITLDGLTVVLSQEIGQLIYGSVGLTLDFLIFNLWLLLLVENRDNLGTAGQRSGLVLFCLGSLLHWIGSLTFSSKKLIGTESYHILSSFLFGILSVFYVHLVVFAVRIIERKPYEIKWTVVWYKWIPAVIIMVAYTVGISLYFQSK